MHIYISFISISKVRVGGIENKHEGSLLKKKDCQGEDVERKIANKYIYHVYVPISKPFHI